MRETALFLSLQNMWEGKLPVPTLRAQIVRHLRTHIFAGIFAFIILWYVRISQMTYQPKRVGKMADFETLTFAGS